MVNFVNHFMLHKKNRLAKDQEIKQVFRQGRGFFNPLFSLKYFKTSSSPRFAIVVSTKVSKKAVKRNRLKRIVREFIRPITNQLAPGDYVLMVKPKAGAEAENLLLSSLKQLMIKANLYKNV